jgi:hypothetical protein
MEPFKQLTEIPPKLSWIEEVEETFTSKISLEQINSSMIKQCDDWHRGTRGGEKVAWIIPKYITLVDLDVLACNFNSLGEGFFVKAM